MLKKLCIRTASCLLVCTLFSPANASPVHFTKERPAYIKKADCNGMKGTFFFEVLATGEITAVSGIRVDGNDTLILATDEVTSHVKDDVDFDSFEVGCLDVADSIAIKYSRLGPGKPDMLIQVTNDGRVLSYEAGQPFDLEPKVETP